MASIAIIGMGLLGAGFALNALEKGHQVRVWNRTRSKCDEAIAAGAEFVDLETIAHGVERVHLVLSEDAIVDQVLSQLNLAADVLVIDHSTNLPARVAERCSNMDANGQQYLHAPVFMGPANSRAATGLMLVSGPADRIASCRAALASMTGRLMELGDDPSRAATVKLTGNASLLVLVAGLNDIFAIGKAGGMSPEETLALFESFGPTLAGMGKRVLASKEGPAAFEMTMARKDLRLMMESAPDSLITLPAIGGAMDDVIAEGHGDRDFAWLGLQAGYKA